MSGIPPPEFFQLPWMTRKTKLRPSYGDFSAYFKQKEKDDKELMKNLRKLHIKAIEIGKEDKFLALVDKLESKIRKEVLK